MSEYYAVLAIIPKQQKTEFSFVEAESVKEAFLAVGKEYQDNGFPNVQLVAAFSSEDIEALQSQMKEHQRS